jgi:hypothetical protein
MRDGALGVQAARRRCISRVDALIDTGALPHRVRWWCGEGARTGRLCCVVNRHDAERGGFNLVGILAVWLGQTQDHVGEIEAGCFDHQRIGAVGRRRCAHASSKALNRTLRTSGPKEALPMSWRALVMASAWVDLM